MKTRTEYVAGFAFDREGAVALVQKNRPAWQKGLLNGIGGHVEPGEMPEEAMAREFEEETGVVTLERDWRHFATVKTARSVVHMFAAKFDKLEPETKTDECIYMVQNGFDAMVLGGVLPNLTWLIPMARLADDILEPIVVVDRAPYETD